MNQRDASRGERKAERCFAKANIHQQRGTENDISFVDSQKENYREFIKQCLELKQQLSSQDEPLVGAQNLRDLLLLSLAWNKTKAASGWYLQRTGAGPVGCWRHVSVSFIRHKVLCSWKRVMFTTANRAQAVRPGSPPSPPSTPSSRENNWQIPSSVH